METTTTTEIVLCYECEAEEIKTDEYSGMCEECYCYKNPHLDTGIGRNCCECANELRMYKWLKIYGDEPKEYCFDCWNVISADEDKEEEYLCSNCGHIFKDEDDWAGNCDEKECSYCDEKACSCDETEWDFRVRVGAIKQESDDE